MKLLLFIALVLMVSCTPKEDKTLITGTIDNPVTENFQIIYQKDFISGERETLEITLDENNSFQTEVDITKDIVPAYLIIEGEDLITIFLEPGIDIHITADGDDIKGTLAFSGTNADNSTFLMEYSQKLDDKFKQQQVFEKIRNLKPAEFYEYAEDMKNTKLKLFEKLSVDKELSNNFKNYFKTNIKFDYYDKQINYPNYHMMLNQLAEEPELPENYYDFIEDAMDLLSDDKLATASYRNFLNSYISYYKKQNPDKVPEEKSHYEQNIYLAEKLYEGKNLEYLKAYYIFHKFNFGEFEKAKEYYETFLEEQPDEEYITILSSIYETTKKLLPGNPAPVFELTDLNDETVSLEDFRGKVVYLDFWASWCGPCMREVPYAKELKSRFKDEEDLVFVYISLDDDLEAWRNTIEAQKMEGVHLKTGGWDHDVPKSYNVKGVPSYFIIDRNGNIFDNRAKRPSTEGVDDDLKAALELVS